MANNAETLGSYLRKERKKREISIDQIAHATRISLKMLRALEEDQHEVLPAKPFVIGYLRAYAKYTKLDPKDILLRYQHHLASNPSIEVKYKRVHHNYSRTRQTEKKQLLYIGILLAGLLLGSGVYVFIKGTSKDDNNKAKKAPTLKVPPKKTAVKSSPKIQQIKVSPAPKIQKPPNKAKKKPPPKEEQLEL